MSFFVGIYQENLRITKTEARWRTLWTFMTIAVACAIVFAVLYFFPWTGSYDQRIDLLPGNHTLVTEISGGDVKVDRQTFLQKAESHETLVAEGNGSIDYLVRDGDFLYHHRHGANYNTANYVITDNKLDGAQMIRSLSRDGWAVFFLYVLFPSIFLFFCVISFLYSIWKNHGTTWNPNERWVWSKH